MAEQFDLSGGYITATMTIGQNSHPHIIHAHVPPFVVGTFLYSAGAPGTEAGIQATINALQPLIMAFYETHTTISSWLITQRTGSNVFNAVGSLSNASNTGTSISAQGTYCIVNTLTWRTGGNRTLKFALPGIAGTTSPAKQSTPISTVDQNLSNYVTSAASNVVGRSGAKGATFAGQSKDVNKKFFRRYGGSI